jgi:UDP-2,3-diacylglucosamine hydrolase
MTRGPIVFLSDLHLAPEREFINRAFFRFLAGDARGAQAVYILGDLFDYWIGDDDLEDSWHDTIVHALAALAAAGTRVCFMHGNRDFLVGQRFADAAGLTILPDPYLLEIGGARTILTHGDALCTLDLAYQAFRSKVRSETWQREFLAKPLDERRALALKLRADSRAEQREKTDEIMDVTPNEVEALFVTQQATRIIHGHTHRPARHEQVIDGRQCERWVLADWYRRGSYLRWDADDTFRPVVLDD